MHITIDELLEYLKKDERYRNQLKEDHDALYIYVSEYVKGGHIDTEQFGRVNVDSIGHTGIIETLGVEII